MSQAHLFEPIAPAAVDTRGEMVIDNFAGGGGASTGIEAAIGRHVDIAINHNAEAIAMHRANHPRTRHYCESVWDVDPQKATGGRPVGLAWFSPDCTHFSRAKGATPKEQGIRGLAWIVLRWASKVRPRVIILENVEEFVSWGPLDEDRLPIKAKAGQTFRLWENQLRGLGYQVERKALVAADYGAPTTRKRLFIVARCDGLPIEWPEPTHGPGREQPHRTAAEIIEWKHECPSIFDRKKVLADKTLERIAHGIQRYCVDDPDPFVANVAGRDAGATLIQTGYGNRPGQAPRVPGLHKPLGTVVAGGCKHALVTAFLAKHYGGVVGHGMRRPIGTVTATDHHSLVEAKLEPGEDRSERVGAFITKYYGTSRAGTSLKAPIGTVTTKARFGLVVVAGLPHRIVDIGMRMLKPRELYHAQSFPGEYEIQTGIDDKGKDVPMTQTAQNRMAGNSVCPVLSRALVEANVRLDERAEVAA